MEINQSNIKEIVIKSGLNPNKALGQNFLINNSISLDIASLLEVKDEEKVLEIGPGLGSVTHHLSNCDLTAVDIDRRMIDFLKIIYQKQDNVKLVLKDILRFDVSNFDKIVGNLPYYITTDIITYLLMNAKQVKKMVFMIQKEALSRFIDGVNQPGYSAIGIYINLIGKIKKCFEVKSHNFYPNPHVDSLVFEIEIDTNKVNEENLGTYRLAKALFLNKRKTILNNLSNYLKNKAFAEEILLKLNVPLNYRPENISPSQYVKIYKLISQQNDIIKK